MLSLGVALLCSVIGAWADQVPNKPQRVVSLNLCTDQLLLALADRDQIASLSYLVRDPSISYLAEKAVGLPINEGKAEAILFEKADLVLAGTYGQTAQVALLKGQGLDVLSLGPWASLQEGREQIRIAAARLGHPDRGEALVAEIDAALARNAGIVRPSRSILAYDRGGWVTDRNAPMSEVLARMGFTLHQDALGLPHGGMARLEALITAPPDYMLADEDSRQAVDNGTALFIHPALVEAVPMSRRLIVPGRLTICGGPSTPAAIDALAAEVRAKVQ